MSNEPELTEAYKKDQDEEKFLEKLNTILEPYQEEDYQDLPELYPTLHIIGAPRSGTTLLSQLVSAHLNIGYINNLIAAFWKAPVFGIRLSKRLTPVSPPASYLSDFGRTQGIHEPHEFGYFWRILLGYTEMLQQDNSFEEAINWERLKLILINMTHAFGHPIVFKSFLLGWHVEKVQKILPRTCFVRIRRNPVHNAMSLIYLREKFLGSVEKWASMKPVEFNWLKHEPYWKQVAGQVYYIERSITEQIQRVSGHNVLEVAYEELCSNPLSILQQIRDLLSNNGGQVEFLSDPPKAFDQTVEPIASEIFKRVNKAVVEFYGQEL